jgi:hypothetical protein
MSKPIFQLLLLAWFLGPTPALRADYLMTASSQGASSRSVHPGDSFTVDISLTSDAADIHNSAIFRLVFSSSGLRYQNYAWSAPYLNGTSDDASFPLLTNLPVVLQSQILTAPDFPDDVVDVYLSNVIATTNSFATGIVARVTCSVPTNYFGPSSINIRSAPDTFANGLTEINTFPGPPFRLTILPTAGLPLPSLSFSRAGPNLTLSWPTALTNVLLESATQMTDAIVWTPLAATNQVVGSSNVVTFPLNGSDAAKFYRLHFQ